MPRSTGADGQLNFFSLLVPAGLVTHMSLLEVYKSLLGVLDEMGGGGDRAERAIRAVSEGLMRASRVGSICRTAWLTYSQDSLWLKPSRRTSKPSWLNSRRASHLGHATRRSTTRSLPFYLRAKSLYWFPL
jgi:hypothetical protein